MRLASRLTILLVIVTTAVAALVGFYAVHTSTRASYAELDSTIDAVIASGQGHPLTALSNAVATLQENNYSLTLDVVGSRDDVTQIVAAAVAMSRRPSLDDVHASLATVRSSPDLPGFRYRSMNIGGGDYLVVAASTASVARTNHQLVERTVVVGVLGALVLAVAARLILERDLRTVRRLIDYAGDVAGGDLAHVVPSPGSSSDFRELQASLAHMVASLQSTIEAEQRLARVTQRFIGDASHELRTPLTVVRGYVELLGSNQVSEDVRARAIDRMSREVARMDQLVSDLLFLAEVNELPVVEPAAVDVSSLVVAAAADFTHDQPDRPITSDIAPGIVIASRGDYLERILVNALTNVARHTGPHDPARVALARVDGAVTLTIEDGGPGLPDDAYGEAPERFRRFDDARSRAAGGSGLGLSIMADIAHALGGSMSTSRSPLGGLALNFRFASAPPT
ncbi:MAG: sensor histidine kinase [Acidimicrobiales bacterium]